jgi:hypothetical protein
LKRAVCDAIGWLDERFGLGLFDDAELWFRKRWSTGTAASRPRPRGAGGGSPTTDHCPLTTMRGWAPFPNSLSDRQVRQKVLERGVVGKQTDPVRARVVIHLAMLKIAIETGRAQRAHRVVVQESERTDVKSR